MVFEGELGELLQQIESEFNKAESAIKVAEQINGEIINPAIYELRYAGRRIVEALNASNNGDADKAASLLRDALFDCLRSRHDAIDAATSKIATDLDSAQRVLGPDILINNFPEVTDLLDKLACSREKIAESRENRNNRDAIYQTIEATDLPEMIRLYRKFRANEGLMKASARAQNMKIYVGWAIGIVGVCIGLIALLSS